jgi:hypothetical protein
MKRLILIFLISVVPYQLLARAQENDTHSDLKSEPAHNTESSAAAKANPALSEEASEILTRMTDFIAAAPAFTLVADTGHEVLQKNGQLLEFGSLLTLAIQRPSQGNGRFDSRAGDSVTTILDGEAIWVYSAKENIYDTTQQTGDIETSLDILAKQLDAPRQLFDFFSKDLTASLTGAVKSGYYVGESMISGVLCDHLALRGEEKDVQMWIARGDEPVPRRIVITHREIDGQPSFWAQFIEWNLSPGLSDTTFTFSPPEGATRVHFFVDVP